MISFITLGGGSEIGANCYYINLSGTGIILDCGMHPKKTGLDSLPLFHLIEDNPLDYVLISHAHQDHLNALPFLIKKFPYLKIITTPQTRAIAELTLRNAITILKRQTTSEEIEMYTHDEVDLLIKSMDYKSYGEKFILRGLNSNVNNAIEAEFVDAGHILGSSGIMFSYDGNKIFYTGDINLSSQTLLNGASVPINKIDTLITETTYGATDSTGLSSWKEEMDRFASSVNKVINNGGSILIPVFSLGKMQEMLAAIWLMMLQNKIAMVDIYTGGLGRKINRVYDYNRYVVNRKEKELILHDIPQKNINEVTNPTEFFKQPSIVLASSGMMIESTSSYFLAKHWSKRKDSAIFTVGYMDEDTPGYKVANAKMGDKIQLNENDKKTKVNCSIKNFKFSAHSKREEIINLVKIFDPENIILVHGEPDAIDWMGIAIFKNFAEKKVYKPLIGKEIMFD
jgi:Cft2 family RNA processing exonuclease